MSAVEDAQTALHLLGALLFAFLFTRAVRSGVVDSGTLSARRMLVALACLAVLFVAMVGTLNYLVNPFGIYPTRLFDPIVLNSRTEKMKRYRRVEPPPEIVVLGGSSSFAMPPAYITALTGRPAFNASLHGGVPADYLAFLRYMVSIGKVPKLLLVPMSVHLVRPNLPTGFEPHNPLEPFIRGQVGDRLEWARWLVTPEQTRASLHLLAVEAKGRPTAHYRFDPDGRARFRESSASLDQIVDSYLATKEWGPDLFRFAALDDAQLSQFRSFLALAHSLGVKVIVYLPPLYPRAEAFYERETNLLALRADLLDRLRAWQTEGLIVAVHDFSHVDSFGGSATEFHDLAHPTFEACRRMLDVMLGPRSRSLTGSPRPSS